MTCKKCGGEVASSASFCEFCGAPVEHQAAEPVQPVYSESQNIESHSAAQAILDQPVQAYNAPAEVVPEKKENMIAGIVGALIGAAIGGGSIVLISRLGYTASICGLILAICTIKGYELLGGKLSKIGLVICVLLIAVTPYLADRIDWAILVMQEFSDVGVTFSQAFTAIPELVKEGAIDSGTYTSNLLMIYLFALIGGGSVIWTAFKKK